ncbi:Parasporal protein [Sporosarcina sp. P13]|uniref:S-layer homology domain-containing protein n=1 Tax=Sporosarcina sp. P13 TaxID=2048263 RepID=UPI000C168532|nr:S-layer homology domain-containing protein [Sporosarcina sp. P13]PIC64638.1 Parasporal protein [Sporosarcina sp. P13]
MRKKFLTVLGVLLLACSLPLSGVASTKLFSDVPSTKHFAEAVYELAERKIIGGYPDGTFKPGNSITRGQAAAIITMLIKLDTTHVKNPGFKDVSTANGYYKAIAALAEKGIIGGYGDGRFGPNDPIKRGQMASILVKAFDLPDYPFLASKNPFKDVKWMSGHDKNILIIYRLGITTGTSTDTFSPNAFITRGQAAKLMRATEEAKSQIITLHANKFNWDDFGWTTGDDTDSEVFNITFEGQKPNEFVLNTIKIIPLKEGTGTLSFGKTNMGDPDKRNYRKYYVHVKEVNGKLKVTLEESDDILPTQAEFLVDNQPVETISLSTMDGKMLSDSVDFKKCGYGAKVNVCIDIDQAGQYIAVLHFAKGKKVRYAVNAELINTNFHYSIWTLKENPTAMLDLGEDETIGRYIVPNNAEKIGTVTRDPDTNRFHVVAKKKGMFEIAFPDSKGLYTGIHINVQQIGSVLHVEMGSSMKYPSDM